MKAIQKGFAQLLDEGKVPQREHIKVLTALANRTAAHNKDVQEYRDIISRNEFILDSYKREVERLHTLPHIKGETGAAGRDADENRIIARVLTQLPVVENGRDADEDKIFRAVLANLPKFKNGVDGKDAVVDEEKLIHRLISRLQSEKLLDISHIKNAQSFIKNGIRYNIEELMHGGGSSSGSTTPLIPTGTVNSTNAVFGVTARPSSVVSDGITYFDGAGYSYSSLSITLDIPPSSYIRYFL